jgi:hypothetical protein
VIAMAEKPGSASPWQVIKTVFWSFLGIHKRAQHERDAVKLKPTQVIVAGIIGAVLFVLTLATLARYVVGQVAQPPAAEEKKGEKR